MASPQKENGYTEIAHELLEAFARLNLSPSDWQILWVILRKTYGWKKKADLISISQFQSLTGLDRKSVCRSIKSLAVKNIVSVGSIRDPKGGKINTYQIQKNYRKWVGFRSVTDDTSCSDTSDTSGSVINGTEVVSRSTEVVVSPVTPTKDNKTNIQKGDIFFDLKEEAKKLKNVMRWNEDRIKQHFLMRGIPEVEIDEAMGKSF